MLRRILSSIIPGIDRLIEKIPPHIRDIIQKASLAFAALVALLVIIAGINKGLRDAKPAGFKLAERNRDLFYLQEMREEYAKKRKLVEDVEVDPLQFPSRQKVEDATKFAAMGRDTMGHLMGEKDEMLKHDDALRPKEKSPGYLGDSYQIPRLAPDKKTLDDGEPLLKKEQIGSAKTPAAPNLERGAKPSEKAAAQPPRAQPAGRDIFDEPQAPTRTAAPTSTEAPTTATSQPKARKSGKMDFME